jgi:hypothetical protein
MLRTSRKPMVAILAAASAIAGGLATGASGEVASSLSAQPSVGGAVEVAVLKHPARTKMLPPKLLTSFASALYLLPIGAPVGSLNGYDFFVIPARDARVCLMGVTGQDATAEDFGGCSPVASLATSVMWITRQAGRGTDVAGLVPDGYDAVHAGGRAVPVLSNVFLIHVDSNVKHIAATGTTVPTRSIALPGTARTGAHRR